MVACEAAGEQDPEPVVGEVAEPAAGSLDLFDHEVGGFDGTVRRAGRVMVEDLGPPPSESLGEATEFGSGFGSGAPGDRIVERVLGDGRVVGEIYVADFLFRDPTVLEFTGRVAVAQRSPDPFPSGLVDAFRAEQEEFAGRIQRVTRPATVTERVVLDALPAPSDSHVREVGSDRSAVSLFPTIGFSGPSPEPDVRLPPHPALHKPMPFGYAASFVKNLLHGVAMAAPR